MLPAKAVQHSTATGLDKPYILGPTPDCTVQSSTGHAVHRTLYTIAVLQGSQLLLMPLTASPPGGVADAHKKNTRLGAVQLIAGRLPSGPRPCSRPFLIDSHHAPGTGRVQGATNKLDRQCIHVAVSSQTQLSHWLRSRAILTLLGVVPQQLLPVSTNP